MTETIDPSFSSEAEMWSAARVAAALGISIDKFKRKRVNLENESFPKPHPILGLYVRDDVRAWIKLQRKLVDKTNISVSDEPPVLSGVNYEKL